MPSRASFATGRYVHQIGFWDNGMPYDGSVPGWGHRLIDAGHRVASIGKLHYRSSDDDNGFAEEILPLHVVDGVGDLLGMLRRPPPGAAARACSPPTPARASRPISHYDRRSATPRPTGSSGAPRRRRTSPGCCSSRSSARTSR